MECLEQLLHPGVPYTQQPRHRMQLWCQPASRHREAPRALHSLLSWDSLQDQQLRCSSRRHWLQQHYTHQVCWFTGRFINQFFFQFYHIRVSSFCKEHRCKCWQHSDLHFFGVPNFEPNCKLVLCMGNGNYCLTVCVWHCVWCVSVS